MKEGRTLSQLASEIERQAGAKKDYIVGCNALSMEAAEVAPAVFEPQLVLTNGTRNVLPIRELAHRQIGERLGIPAKYYDRMLTSSQRCWPQT